MTPRPRQTFLGLPLDPLNQQQVLDWIDQRCASAQAGHVVTLNPDVVLRSLDDAAMGEAVVGADLVLADGIGVVWSARLLGITVQQRVTGADLIHPLAALAARRGYPIFLVSARPGVVDEVATQLCREHPELKVAGSRTVPFRPLRDEEEAELAHQVQRSGARILLAALGAGKQEPWIHRRLPEMGGAVALGCGAALDFLVGAQQRAPGWLRRIGLEWLYRLHRQPRRLWRRYLLRGPRFLLVVLGARLGFEQSIPDS